MSGSRGDEVDSDDVVEVVVVVVGEGYSPKALKVLTRMSS